VVDDVGFLGHTILCGMSEKIKWDVDRKFRVQYT
jgi:hypothetical protein